MGGGGGDLKRLRQNNGFNSGTVDQIRVTAKVHVTALLIETKYSNSIIYNSHTTPGLPKECRSLVLTFKNVKM